MNALITMYNSDASIDDIGYNSLEMIKKLKIVIENYNLDTEIIAASIRGLEHYLLFILKFFELGINYMVYIFEYSDKSYCQYNFTMV